MSQVLKSEDVLVLLKLSVWGSTPWHPGLLSEELGHTSVEIIDSLDRLRSYGLLSRSADRISAENFRKFLFTELKQTFPVEPGQLVKGILTGAKPESFFTTGLPNSCLYVWPKADGFEQGYEIIPFSPHCCFAVLNDSRLRHLLAVVETIRLAGVRARSWADEEINKIVQKNLLTPNGHA